MSITIEAIYEAGVLKPLTPLPNLKEREKVRLIVEAMSVIAQQRRERISLDPAVAQAIGDSPDYSLLEG